MCCPPAMPRSGCSLDLDVSSAGFGGNALLHAQDEMAREVRLPFFVRDAVPFDRCSAKVGSLHLSEKDL